MNLRRRFAGRTPKGLHLSDTLEKYNRPPQGTQTRISASSQFNPEMSSPLGAQWFSMCRALRPQLTARNIDRAHLSKLIRQSPSYMARRIPLDKYDWTMRFQLDETAAAHVEFTDEVTEAQFEAFHDHHTHKIVGDIVLRVVLPDLQPDKILAVAIEDPGNSMYFEAVNPSHPSQEDNGGPDKLMRDMVAIESYMQQLQAEPK